MGNELQAILEPRPQNAPVDSEFWRHVFTNPEMPEKTLISHVQYMLENNVDVSSRDNSGVVPIYRVVESICARKPRYKMMMMMLCAGVDVTLRINHNFLDFECAGVDVTLRINHNFLDFNACEIACIATDKYVFENILACKTYFDLRSNFMSLLCMSFRPKYVDSTFKIDLLIMAL